MPAYHVYQRGKNSKMARPVLNGEPITAVDAQSACVKAVHKDPQLRIGRLVAKPVPPIVEATITTKNLEPMTPMAMKEMLTGKKEDTNEDA